MTPEAEIARLVKANNDLTAENAVLKARITELERQLGLNSSNSGKPPSSDGLKKPPADKDKKRRTRSLREKSPRKPGGQKGHKGETLRQVSNPDKVTDHFPKTCTGCGSPLSSHRGLRPQPIELYY